MNQKILVTAAILSAVMSVALTMTTTQTPTILTFTGIPLLQLQQAFAQVAEEEDANNIGESNTETRSNSNCNISGIGSSCIVESTNSVDGTADSTSTVNTPSVPPFSGLG
jgi:hypothetical protein